MKGVLGGKVKEDLIIFSAMTVSLVDKQKERKPFKIWGTAVST